MLILNAALKALVNLDDAAGDINWIRFEGTAPYSTAFLLTINIEYVSFEHGNAFEVEIVDYHYH